MIWQILGSVIFLVKSLDFLYLFQTKEYRLDRILSFFTEENVFKLAYLRRPRLPAKSSRNILIFFWLLLALLFLSRMASFQNLFYLFIAPVYSLVITLAGVLISDIPVQIYRRYIINKAYQKVKNSTATFIGITGSYGKTTTKELLYQLLSEKFNVAKTDKNYNSEIGVALSVLKNLKSDTQYFIAELGAYRKGEIKAACNLINPTYGILTGIGNQHLSLFGSKQNLKEAKAELLEALPKDGIAYINMDIEDRNFFASKTQAKKVFYSIDNPLYPIKTNIEGKHNLQNLLPCVALAIHLGMDKKLIDRVLMELKPVQARLSQEVGINGSTALNDSYNSNLDGFKLAVATGKQMPGFTKKIIISRGLIELGEEKLESYQTIINELDKSDLTLITTDELFKKLDKKNKVRYFAKESTLLEYIQNNTDKKTLLIIEGRFEPKTLQILLRKE